MSNVLMCDSCGIVRSKTAARPEGWVSLRTLVALGHVVPETHPFHHERHLCSVECLQEFIQVAVDGGILPVDDAEVLRLPSRNERQREVGQGTTESADLGAAPPREPITAIHAAESPASSPEPTPPSDLEPVGEELGDLLPVMDSPGSADPAGADAPVTRLSDLIAQKLARGDGDRVDLREIAAKPAVKRRIK